MPAQPFGNEVPIPNPDTPDFILTSTRDKPTSHAEHALSPSMASPTPDHVLGQFSFVPTTQTTVVTTTTTTTSTTSFPPLRIKAPGQSRNPDPKLYPLAATPTPHYLRTLCFDVGGRSAVFQEAENASDTYKEVGFKPHTCEGSKLTSDAKVKQRHEALRRSDGIIRTVVETHSDVPSGNMGISKPPIPNKALKDMTPVVEPTYRGQPASPVSISTAAKTARQHAARKRRNISSQTPCGKASEQQASSQDSLQSRLNLCKPISHVDDEFIITDSSLDQTERVQRPRPQRLDTGTAQDISLPSPSLSPVTAAANLQNRRGYFEGSMLESEEAYPNLDVGQIQSQESLDTQLTEDFTQSTVQESVPRLSARQSTDVQPPNQQTPSPSMMNIPTMLDSFEAMPTEMKTYVMYQLLRRSPKELLQTIANVVNPALKCNFLTMLPRELSLTIVGYLDLKSLCSAAQVSKDWRRIANTSEKVWKHRFDADGYELPEEELQKAIREGWGWQYSSSSEDWERDLSGSASVASDTELSASSTHTGLRTGRRAVEIGCDSPTLQGRSGKRKAGNKLNGKSRKQQKRSHNSTAYSDAGFMMEDLTKSEGAYAAANAAAAAVPNAQVGLSSLRQLHLFKSIYQRHHLIRRSWMMEEPKPSHLAFRAHQRHVVTCLQFDADKILTGSDDTNINVYDTQTGVLRATLKGHEGGVWALQYEGSVLVSGSTDRSVRVWDIEKGVCTQVFQGHTSTVRCLQILMPTAVGTGSDGRHIMMPKQPLIITGSRDSNLRVWKLPKPNDERFFQAGPAADDNDCPYFVRVLTGHHHSVRAIAAHADTLVSGSYDCTVRVWKISTGETVHRLTGHTQKVYSVVLDHKRNRCISGSMDNLVKVWSLDTGTVLFNLEGHSSLVGLLDLQGDRLVSAAADSTLRIWDPENGHCKSTLSAHTGAITCFQHDGQKVISGSDRTLKMWNAANGEFAKDLLTDLSGVWQVKFNERRCVAAVQRNNLTYIEVSILLAGHERFGTNL